MKILVLKKDASSGFRYLAGINRPIIPSQVTKLSKSLLSIGCIRPIVVGKIGFLTGKEEDYVIDGQHLMNALIRNNMDIPYIYIQIEDKSALVEKIALLNSSSKSWTLLDYVTAWGSIKEDYKTLNYYYNIYDFELSILASALSNSNASISSGGNITRQIKSGTFEVSDLEENLSLLDKLTDVLHVVPRMNRYENRYLCSEYISFLRTNKRKYNHTSFLKKLKERKKELLLVTLETGKLSKMFETFIK